MTTEEIESKLAVLRENLERLEALPQGTYEEFMADFRTADSILTERRGDSRGLADQLLAALERQE